MKKEYSLISSCKNRGAGLNHRYQAIFESSETGDSTKEMGCPGLSRPFIFWEFFKTEQKVSSLMEILASAKAIFKHLEQPNMPTLITKTFLKLAVKLLFLLWLYLQCNLVLDTVKSWADSLLWTIRHEKEGNHLTICFTVHLQKLKNHEKQGGTKQ